MTIQELREEIYNDIIQEESHLQYEYEGDELQDIIMDMVEERIMWIRMSLQQ
jgi:hypothetical protein